MSADLRRSFKQKAKQAFELPSRLRKGLADHLDGSENRPMSFDFGCLEDNRIFAFQCPNKECDIGMKSRQRIVIQPRGTFKYQVTGKDTLRSLAAQHSTTASELKTINRFHSDTIFEGQTIYIPDETYLSCHVNEQKETSDTTDDKLPIILQDDVTEDVESKVEVELLSYKPLQRLIYGGQDLLFTGIKPILSVTKHITPDTLQILGSSSSSTEASSENNIQFIKVPAKYIKDKNVLSSSVSGLLLLSADFIMFDPDPCDLLVKEGGIEEFSNIIPITELGSITLIKNADSVTSDRNQIIIKETGEQLAKKFEAVVVDKPQLKINEHRMTFEEGNELQVISNVPEKEKSSQPLLEEQESTREFAEKAMYVTMSIKTRSETSVEMQRGENKESEVFEAALDRKVFDKKRSTSMRKERPLSIVGNLFRLGGLESSSSEVSTPTTGNKTTFGGGGSVENISSSPSGSRLVSRTLSSLSTYSSTLLDDVSSHLFSSASSTPKLQAISASPSSPTPSSTTQQGERVFFLKPIDALTKKVKEQLSSSVESTGDEDDKESDVFLLLKIIPANDSDMYIDYLFAVQQDRTSTLFTFFLYWMPTTQLDQSCFDEPWFVLADRTSEIEQNYHQQQQQGYNSGNVEDIEQKKKAKEWKIVSLQEVKRLLLISEIEKLPLPDLTKKSDILDQNMVKQLTFYLPPRAEGCKWDLSYSTEVHGFSLKTLLRRVENVDGSIMIVIKDDKNQVFGSMLSCTLKPCDTFYGNGECYLFSFYRKFKKFGWSGLNNYFIYATLDSISIGSGEGAVGLWLDGDLYYGRTQQCQTYKNDLLTENQDFIVRCLEVWRFV